MLRLRYLEEEKTCFVASLCMSGVILVMEGGTEFFDFDSVAVQQSNLPSHSKASPASEESQWVGVADAQVLRTFRGINALSRGDSDKNSAYRLAVASRSPSKELEGSIRSLAGSTITI